MSSIGGIGGASGFSSSSIQRQRPDPATIADSVFSKLDTKGQGYLEVSDLESAFSKIDSATTVAPVGTNAGAPSATDLFKKLDTDSDGKITKNEFSTGLKKLSDELESQFNASRTSYAEGASRPSGPPPGGRGRAAGGDGDGAVSGTDSTTSSTSKTYDAADTNQDGKVSFQETLAYIEKTIIASTSANSTSNSSSVDATSSTSASTSSSTSADATQNTDNSGTRADAALFRKALELLRAYSDPAPSNGGSASNSISVTA